MTTHQEKHPDDREALAATALAVEDFEEAASALMALKREAKSIARDVTLKILHDHIGDVFYQALAFEVLYSVALNDAVAYIASHASTESVYVLGAMIESVTEDVGALTCQDEILRAVSLLRKVLMMRSQKDLASLAVKIMRFEEAYRFK